MNLWKRFYQIKNYLIEPSITVSPKIRKYFFRNLLVFKTVDRCRNSSSAIDEIITTESIHRHYRCRLGDKWVESDRLFVKWNGEPMNNQTPYGWLKEFCEKNDMPFYGIHSFRHFAASALISSGLDVVTVSGALGHCNSGTTLNVYAHMFQTAQARVAQAMDGAFSFLPQDTTT